MLVAVHDTLRSAGRELVLEPGTPPQLEALVDELRAAAEALAADPDATDLQRDAATSALDLLDAAALCPSACSTSTRAKARGPAGGELRGGA